MPKNISYEELEALADRDGKIPRWNSDMEDEGYLPPPKVQNYIDDRDAGRVAVGCPRPTCYRESMELEEKLRSKLRAKEKREKEAKRIAAKKKREADAKSRLDKKVAAARAMLEQGKSMEESVAAASNPSVSLPIRSSESTTPKKPPAKKKRSTSH